MKRNNKIRDDLALGRLSRRDVAKMMAAAGLAMVTMPAGRAAQAAASDLVYFTWSGYDLPGFFPAYIEKNGGPPATALFADEEEALQKLRSGFECDVVHPCSARTERWREAGVIQAFDPSRLSHWPDVFDTLKSINGANADGQQWFCPIDWGNTSVIYRTDLFDLQGQEESWTMLWDERYAGRLSIGEDITDTGVICGLLLGAADPYNLTDEELVKVRELLQQQKPLIRFYWNDTTALEQAMASGEVVASSAWNSSVVALRDVGVPVAYANPKEGILAWCCGLVVTSTSTQLDLAHDLLDAMIAPEAGAWLTTEYGYGHSNRKTFELVDEATLETLGLPKDPTELMSRAMFSRVNGRLDELQQIFEEVKAGLCALAFVVLPGRGPAGPRPSPSGGSVLRPHPHQVGEGLEGQVGGLGFRLAAVQVQAHLVQFGQHLPLPGVADEALDPGDGGDPLALGHRVDPVQGGGRVDHGGAGRQLHLLRAPGALEEELAADVARRVGEEQRHRQVAALVALLAHQRVVDVQAVLHARLVAADQDRPDRLGEGGGAEAGVLAHRGDDELLDLVAAGGVALHLQVVLHHLGAEAGGRLAVLEGVVAAQLAHHLGELLRVQHVVENG